MVLVRSSSQTWASGQASKTRLLRPGPVTAVRTFLKRFTSRTNEQHNFRSRRYLNGQLVL
eukprot:4470711-Pleurochrysis_carterae.AAC.1